MKNVNKIFLLFMFVAFSAFAFGQTTITGTVTSKDDGTELPGVTVVAKGTTVGTITDLNGKYKIDAPAGTQFLVFSYLGMETMEIEISGQSVIDMQLSEMSEELVEIFVIADRARERETPVAFSDITEEEIQQQLGSRDIPLVMNMTPSVYSTVGGGGAGDARINVRGFNQRNVAIMINGVPVNDMENGWVYWSNWDGIGDATSSIQLQRGLSAINLATPSIGGTMNIITSPAEHNAGGSAKLEYGSGNFMKGTITGHTGMINDQFALSASLVYKQGAGVIDGTWTRAAAYYLGATYKASKNQKFELFVMGAPQRHGQNLYKQNIGAYGSDIAADFDADQSTIDRYFEANADDQYPGFDGARSGRYYNENWSPVSTSYTGKQWWNGKEHDRFAEDFINERENYFHKPLANLNWYATWSDKIRQYTTVYYSGGKGGGTGTYGSVRWNYHEGIPSPSRFVNYDLTIEQNTQSDTAFGILRNSVNNQWTVGALSRVKMNLSDNLTAQVGIDWRTAEIEHFREVRDLLGGQFFVENIDEFSSTPNKTLGDKIAYHNTNTVNWFGYFVQAEYATESLTAYATFGNSYLKYSYTDFFRSDAANGDYLKLETDFLPGYQIKGGVSYRPIGGFSVFANYGYISKNPIFDNVISDDLGQFTGFQDNEIFNAFEVGVNYRTPRRNLDVKANYYYTTWVNRSLNYRTEDQDGNDINMFVYGMDQLHSGFELEAFYKPIQYVEIGAMASIGNWEHTNDVSGNFKYYDGTNESDTTYTIYSNGLKVGDAPQTQFAGMLVIKPINDLRIQFDGRYYTNHYSDFVPFTRDDENDRDQVWLTPSYFLTDLHISYHLPLKGEFGIEVFGHIFNLLDEIYIQDAVDNSPFNGNYDNGLDPADAGYEEFNHDVNTAEVYLGLPRTFNAGIVLTF